MTIRRDRTGVTLIEMVVVMALIGIMAGVVAPSIVSPERGMTSESALDRVEALLRFAKATAIDRARRVNLVIDPATSRFWLDLPDTAGDLALPEGATLLSSARRVHIQLEPTGKAAMSDALFVRQGESTTAVRADR
jgi:prepilin-type N-terminal cleavage/methylation domain-containing protein